MTNGNEPEKGLTKLEVATFMAMQGLCASNIYTNEQIRTEVGGEKNIAWGIGLLAKQIAQHTIDHLNDPIDYRD